MMSCHSVRSCHSPLRSLKFSLVAKLNFATGVPLGVYLTSGSFPRFPTRITLFTLFGIVWPPRSTLSVLALPCRSISEWAHNLALEKKELPPRGNGLRLELSYKPARAVGGQKNAAPLFLR